MRSFFARHRRVAILAAIIVAAIGGAYYWSTRPASSTAGSAGGGRGANGNRIQPVSVAEIKRADVPIWVSAVGTAVPRNLVTVRARVDGELMKLHFREGEVVKQGQLLAEIDPRPYQVQFDQAAGQLARDTASLENAKADLSRYRDLWAKDSIAKQQLDTQEALVRQSQGTVESDRAQVDNAKLQLVFARITAPVSGRIGLRAVDPGNQVHASDANGIGIIAQLQPMTVVFAVPESYLPSINKRIASGEEIAVEAWDREQKIRLASGRLLTTDNLIDTATGTIKMKAEFANKDSALFPNQFVNTRLLLGVRKDALVVPGAAVLQGARGAFVYVVDSESAVTSVAVTPGPVDGGQIAVDGKIEPGGRVVTDGADKLRDGAKVEVITPGASTAAAKGARAPGSPGAAGGSADERQKRWAETNARIDRGEFGEEIKKLPEEERKQRMREMRRQQGGGAASQNQ
jgi:membrane fusion protein, multidrug efflux system